MIGELALGMPPIPNIQHQINLVLGSNLPYKLAYRLCPKKADGLQRQVEKLLEKGYIQESMNPYIVLAS
jgi:hypothetical protein